MRARTEAWFRGLLSAFQFYVAPCGFQRLDLSRAAVWAWAPEDLGASTVRRQPLRLPSGRPSQRSSSRVSSVIPGHGLRPRPYPAATHAEPGASS